MTPRKSAALVKELGVKCDTSYMFACRVGTGAQVACKCTADPLEMLTLFLALLDGMFERLDGKPEKIKEFKTAFAALMEDYMEDEL